MIGWQETDARLPGWTAIINPDTKSRKYRAPDGNVVGAWAYNSAIKHYERTGVVPQSPLGSKWKGHQKNNADVYSRKSSVNDEEVFEIPVPGTDEFIPVDLPEPKSTTSSHRRSGLFTSKELSLGLQSILVILTSIIAIGLQLPEAQMTDIEVKSVSISLGNIFERSKYNRVVGQLVVDKSDYLQLGYALYMYIDRVAAAARERKSNDKSSGTIIKDTKPDSGTNGTGAGASLRSSPSGLRNIITGN